MRRFIASIALLTAATAASAGTFGVHLGSHHFPDAGMNNFNPGAYYRSDSGLVAGAYLNSDRKWSTYAAKIVHVGPIDVALGAVTGYPAAPVLPMVVPSYRFDSGLRVAVVPKSRFNVLAVHFMMEF